MHEAGQSKFNAKTQRGKGAKNEPRWLCAFALNIQTKRTEWRWREVEAPRPKNSGWLVGSGTR